MVGRRASGSRRLGRLRHRLGTTRVRCAEEAPVRFRGSSSFWHVNCASPCGSTQPGLRGRYAAVVPPTKPELAGTMGRRLRVDQNGPPIGPEGT
jgi:hypothetical protein